MNALLTIAEVRWVCEGDISLEERGKTATAAYELDPGIMTALLDEVMTIADYRSKLLHEGLAPTAVERAVEQMIHALNEMRIVCDRLPTALVHRTTDRGVS